MGRGTMVFQINAVSVLIYKVDSLANKVLATVVNSETAGTPVWCSIVDEYYESTEEVESGFYLGRRFVPFCECEQIC